MPKRFRVKFCGMTNEQDALDAAFLGVDAIGLIFHPPSPRNVPIEVATKIVMQLPPFVTKVGVFVNEDPAIVSQIIKQVPLNYLQFHGQESVDYCRAFGLPYIKVIQVGTEVMTSDIMERYPDACAFLFDTYCANLHGGSGLVFNWELVPKGITKPWLLAGGLSCENIAQALTQLKPYGVDVTSGIESKKGKKDLVKMKEFLRIVAQVNAT